MKDEFQGILNIVKERPGRARLEPYGELIDELRRRLTYRDISDILTEKCQSHDSKAKSLKNRELWQAQELTRLGQ